MSKPAKQNDPRTRENNSVGDRGGARAPDRPPSPCPGAGRVRPAVVRHKPKTRRNQRQGNLSGNKAEPRLRGDAANPISERLSATDISALASMKNVAKCDTWCELQNPVNHRVFERKLRPRPSGRGHVCLGVTHSVAPAHTRCGRGAEIGPPSPFGHGRHKCLSLAAVAAVKWWLQIPFR